MKNFLGLLVILVFSTFTYAQSGAKIDFKSETVDYGTIYKGEDNGLRTFEFTNTGDAPLIIKGINPTNGFSIQSQPRDPILPGKSAKIEVKYNMNLGPIRKTITVESNAINHANGIVALKIKGNILEKK